MGDVWERRPPVGSKTPGKEVSPSNIRHEFGANKTTLCRSGGPVRMNRLLPLESRLEDGTGRGRAEVQSAGLGFVTSSNSTFNVQRSTPSRTVDHVSNGGFASW